MLGNTFWILYSISCYTYIYVTFDFGLKFLFLESEAPFEPVVSDACGHLVVRCLKSLHTAHLGVLEAKRTWHT